MLGQVIPLSRLKANTALEHACRAVWQTKEAVRQTKVCQARDPREQSNLTDPQIIGHKPREKAILLSHAQSHDLWYTLSAL